MPLFPYHSIGIFDILTDGIDRDVGFENINKKGKTFVRWNKMSILQGIILISRRG